MNLRRRSKSGNLPLTSVRDMLVGDFRAQIRNHGPRGELPDSLTVETTFSLIEPLDSNKLSWLRAQVKQGFMNDPLEIRDNLSDEFTVESQEIHQIISDLGPHGQPQLHLEYRLIRNERYLELRYAKSDVESDSPLK